MKLKAIPIILAISIFLFGFSPSDVNGEDNYDCKPAKAMEKVLKVKEIILKDAPRAAHREFITYNMIGNITFCGMDVIVETGEGGNLVIKWGGDKQKDVPKKGGLMKLESGDESVPIMIVNDEEKGWGYFNPVVREAKLETGMVRFYDVDANGKYFDEKIDAVMYGEKACVSPLMPVQWYYHWNIKCEFEVDAKPSLKVVYTPIEALPEERKAGINLNEFRMGIGLPAVPLGKSICRKAREYANFIDANGGDTGEWSVIQNPQPSHAGYTPACSEMKDSYFFCYDGAEAAILDMFTQFYHRAQFFFPDTKEFGIGAHGAISVFNGALTRDAEYMPWTYPIVLPASEQTISTYSYFGKYGGETPSAATTGSFPISVIFENPPEKINVDSFYLKKVEKRKETELDASCFWPGRPAHATQPKNQGQILIMGKKPFAKKSRYHVMVEYTLDNEKHKLDWYFNTAQK